MTADYVRTFYRVPAKRGGRITFGYQAEREGTIVGFRGQYLRVRFDDTPKVIENLHPTWKVDYQ